MGSTRRTHSLMLHVVLAAFLSFFLAGSLPATAASNQPPDNPHAMAPPERAWDMLDYLRDHNWTPPPGIAGGAPYKNSDGKLPDCTDGTWREYDVTPPGPQGRGPERIVRCDSAWIMPEKYTPDHYATFEEFIQTASHDR